MADLTSLGFRKDVFSETIVATYNPDGYANSAPMGLKLLDLNHLSLNIFNTSQTCQNLKTTKCATINLTGDIEVFYKSALKEANLNGNIPPEWFIKAQTVQAPKLRVADACIEVIVEKAVSEGDRTSFSCKVTSLSAEKLYPQVYCRAFPLTLEAITHATRIKAFAKDPARQEEVANMVKIIRDYAAIVGRVAPNSQYTTVMADLQHRFAVWGVNL